MTYDDICDVYEVVRTNLDDQGVRGTLPGADHTAARVFALTRRLMGEMSWPDDKWSFASLPSGQGTPKKGFYADKVFVDMTHKSLNMTLLLTMKHGDVVKVDLSAEVTSVNMHGNPSADDLRIRVHDEKQAIVLSMEKADSLREGLARLSNAIMQRVARVAASRQSDSD